MTRLLSLLAALLLATTANALSAQTDARGYWESLQRAGTPGEVGAVKAPRELEPRVAEALRQLRRYELEPVRATAYRARQELQQLAERRRNDVWTHFALAVVLRRGPDAHIRNSDPPTYWFVDHRSLASAGALRALRRVLELDPQFEPGALEFARFAAERPDATLQAEADDVLARIEQSGEVLLERAVLALRRDDADAALRFATSAAHAGADASLAAHLRASALLLDPATEKMGAAAYMDGLRKPGARALNEYYRTAAPILRVEETQAWDTMRGERRAAWLREVWELRAAQAGVSVAERLGAHYRRLRRAHIDYPLIAPLRAEDNEIIGGVGILVGEELRRHGLSPQGLMLVRYGDAAWLRWLGICGTVPYVSGGRRGRIGLLDPVLPPGGRRPLEPGEIHSAPDFRRVQQIDCSNPTSIRHYAQELTSGDRFAPAFDNVLTPHVELYAFRGTDGADVIAGVTLSRAQLATLAAPSQRIALHTAVMTIDTVARRTTRTEQPLVFTLPAEQTEHVLLASRSATSLTGSVDVRVSVADSARRAGTVVAMRHDVPDFDQRGLLLSDLVVTPDDDAARAQRGTVALAIAAGRRYRVGETFRLYYEVYGLEEGANYRTRIVLAPRTSPLWRAVNLITGREPDVVALQFDERAPEPLGMYGVQQLRSVTTSSLRPGTYRLRIEVTSLATGATTTRERLLDIDG